MASTHDGKEVGSKAGPGKVDFKTANTYVGAGYGDAVPTTMIGKGFAQVVMILGVGLTAAFIGIVGSNVYYQVQKLERVEEQKKSKE